MDVRLVAITIEYFRRKPITLYLFGEHFLEENIFKPRLKKSSQFLKTTMVFALKLFVCREKFKTITFHG